MQMSNITILLKNSVFGDGAHRFFEHLAYVEKYNKGLEYFDQLMMSTLSDDIVGVPVMGQPCTRSYKVFGHPDNLKTFIQDQLSDNQLDVYLEWVNSIVL